MRTTSVDVIRIATKGPGDVSGLLSLIEAERNFVNLKDRYYETMADYFRRRATLERAIGGVLDQLPHQRHGSFRLQQAQLVQQASPQREVHGTPVIRIHQTEIP